MLAPASSSPPHLLFTLLHLLLGASALLVSSSSSRLPPFFPPSSRNLFVFRNVPPLLSRLILLILSHFFHLCFACAFFVFTTRRPLPPTSVFHLPLFPISSSSLVTFFNPPFMADTSTPSSSCSLVNEALFLQCSWKNLPASFKKKTPCFLPPLCFFEGPPFFEKATPPLQRSLPP